MSISVLDMTTTRKNIEPTEDPVVPFDVLRLTILNIRVLSSFNFYKLFGNIVAIN